MGVMIIEISKLVPSTHKNMYRGFVDWKNMGCTIEFVIDEKNMMWINHIFMECFPIK